MGMKFFIAAGISVCRRFSTKSSTSSQPKKYAQSGYKYGRAKRAKPEPKFVWTDEQKEIMGHVQKGLSVFITGSAGTGKTVLLEHIVRILKRVHQKSRVFVTASTGVAACALHGQTLHSFVGVGLIDDDRDALLEKVLTSKSSCKRWKKVKALVIDEISMVDPNMFENLEYVARVIRGSDEVWGGIQLIVSGDFFQLPPVSANWNSSAKVFTFEADCWDASFGKQVELMSIFRQSDPRLIKLLQGIRKGESGGEDLELLKQCCSANEPDGLVVRLYPLIKHVNKVNEERMRSLDEEIITYEAYDGGTVPFKKQLKQGIAPGQLALCKGARVMLIKNLNIWQKLCNGAAGTVMGFVKSEDNFIRHCFRNNLLPIVKFDTGLQIVIEPQRWEILEGNVAVAWRYQIPLILAWALSIHKCQGMTLDSLHTDLSNCFSYGMAYVALSRVRSFEGLHLSGFSPLKIMAHPKVLHFYECLASKQFGENKKAEDDTNISDERRTKTLDGWHRKITREKKFDFSLP